MYRVLSERSFESEDICKTINFCIDSEIPPLETVQFTEDGTKYEVPKEKLKKEYLVNNALKVVQLTDFHVDTQYAAVSINKYTQFYEQYYYENYTRKEYLTM